MSLFLLTVFCIYGSVHVYAFCKAQAAFPLGIALRVCWASSWRP
jgi:hypothetical protein